MKQADQNSIMLYSQRNGYIFDMTYACHEATEQFKKFKSKAVPFRQMIKKNNVEVARFDSLINYLYGMSTMFLSEEAQVNRNVDDSGCQYPPPAGRETETVASLCAGLRPNRP